MNTSESNAAGPRRRSISNLISSDDASSSMRRNKELYSSFRDTYFSHYCGSCKEGNRFLRGPLYERVFMNVLLVNWKMFPPGRRCRGSCNLACLVDWRRGKRKAKKCPGLSRGRPDCQVGLCLVNSSAYASALRRAHPLISPSTVLILA